MTHTISVDFTGLCVFATKNVPERLSVLMATDTMKGMGHRPILSFNVRNLKTFTGGPMGQVIQLPGGAQVASWHLSGKIVRLSAETKASPDKIVLCGGGAPRSLYPEGPQAEMDLCWVPSLKRITGQGDVDPVYLGDNPVPRKGKPGLAARVDLDHGFLFANAAVNRLQRRECWTIKTTGGRALRQYLADTVSLEFATEDKVLQLEATPFGGGLKETLTLEPQDGRIELSITNLADALPHGKEPTAMTHFEAYYDLLRTVPKNRPVPVTAKAAAGAATPPRRSHSEMTAAIQGVYPVRCAPGMIP